ncbi:hypothetical protein BC937DRAFT_92885 [Endogone sp. FLAS-F59071]|nr:hypothetical protein BC937DRAFT_92885 [Endogone sp. FLAS-F59071]|eukprot:RUS15111.1 hypothetical protein BC937DRAFT_92885 [Endogone sp. FLAS-F59071]
MQFDTKTAYEIADAQQTLQAERFRILRAAVTGNYTLTEDTERPEGEDDARVPDVEISMHKLTVVFPDKGAPVRDVVLLEEEAGGRVISADSVAFNLEELDENEKFREGGVLYLVGDSTVFWSMIQLWHQTGTTGLEEWDKILATVKEKPSDASRVDCMFFSTPFGCLQHTHRLDPSCPFRHDDQRKKRLRERVIKDRLASIGLPTSEERQRLARKALQTFEESKKRKPTEEEVDEYFELYVAGDNRARVFCKYCDKPEPTEADEESFKRCKRCRSVWYCSVECQRTDWKEHKRTCQPWEKIVYRE